MGSAESDSVLRIVFVYRVLIKYVFGQGWSPGWGCGLGSGCSIARVFGSCGFQDCTMEDVRL